MKFIVFLSQKTISGESELEDEWGESEVEVGSVNACTFREEVLCTGSFKFDESASLIQNF